MKNIKRFKSQLLLIALLLTLLCGISLCSHSQKKEPIKNVLQSHLDTKPQNIDRVNEEDFLTYAAEISIEAIKLGQLAQLNGSVVDVKELGKKMEKAYTQYSNELSVLARKQLIILPLLSTSEANNIFKKLSKTYGKSFDIAYAERMVNTHKNAIVVFEKASAQQNDVVIKQWATATLADLRILLVHAMLCLRKCEKLAY